MHPTNIQNKVIAFTYQVNVITVTYMFQFG